MRFKVMSKSMKVLVLAGVLSFVAASAVQAGGHSTSGDFHANAVPAGDTAQSVASGTARSGQIPRFWHPVLAGDGGPGGIGDGTGRSQASNTTGEWHPVLAEDGPPGTAGGRNGRSQANAAPACGDQCPVLADDTGPGSPGDNNGRADLGTDANQMLAGDGGPGSPGDNNGRSQASNTTGEWHPVLATEGPGGINDGNGRTAALVTGDWHPMLAGDGGPTGAGENNG
jgi:hypothetical protein